ncbi:MAG TPA: MBL fold metallo-hydrolase [Clostridia bacterium]|nr:MBL fold metallo-hydrolase [Clostridia bacterium]
MLQIDFINVGDGDAVLAREYRKGRLAFTLLVDCGRPEVNPLEGSRRLSAAQYLREQGVAAIDLMAITHLHLDHFGGIPLLAGIPVRRLIAGYLPGESLPAIQERPVPGGNPSIAGLYTSLDIWTESVRRLRCLGCAVETAACDRTLPLTRRLRMRITCPDGGIINRQIEAFSAIAAGRCLPESTLYTVSKERNNSSLRILLEYAGRRILLPGDAYGAFWEQEQDAAPCDILKLPHHGDEKSLTQRLLRRLRPRYAVISGLMGALDKHRPARSTVRLLRREGTRIASLENEAIEGLRAQSHRAAVFILRESGRFRRRAGMQTPGYSGNKRKEGFTR